MTRIGKIVAVLAVAASVLFTTWAEANAFTAEARSLAAQSWQAQLEPLGPSPFELPPFGFN